MTTPAIHHIVFDIGKVLIHYDPHLAFLDILPDADERQWFLTHICTSAWNLEQDRGRSWAEAEEELIERFPEQEERILHFRRNWLAMVPHAYEESVLIMLKLIETGHDVTMLTNFATDTLVEARQRFPFLNAPRGVTVSGEIGLLKPERGIYDHHIKTFGLTPAHTLFIDDSLPNVVGAQAAGWQSVHFTDPQKLRADLVALGVAI